MVVQCSLLDLEMVSLCVRWRSNRVVNNAKVEMCLRIDGDEEQRRIKGMSCCYVSCRAGGPKAGVRQPCSWPEMHMVPKRTWGWNCSHKVSQSYSWAMCWWVQN